MNAILSGRSGRALLLDGESLRSFDLDDPSTIVPRRRSDLPYFFGEAADLRILQNTTIESVAQELRMDCHFTWALDLTLISLDSELKDDIRKEALEELEELFAERTTLIRVENVLYSEPLPDDADLKGALTLCGDVELPLVFDFLRRLDAHQPLIEKANLGWESITTKTFGTQENRKTFRHTAVKEGLCRDLVTLGSSVSVFAFLSKTRLNKSVQQLPNHHEVLHAWSTPFQQLCEAAEFRREDEEDSDSERPFRALEALIKTYDKLLRLEARRILRTRMPSEAADAEAEDIVQEVYMDVWIKGIKIVNEPVGANLIAKVHDKAYSRIRGNVGLDKTLADVRIDEQSELAKKEFSEPVQRQISELSREDQLMLHFFAKGLSIKEIARTLNISQGDVRYRLLHAKQRLSRTVKRARKD